MNSVRMSIFPSNPAGKVLYIDCIQSKHAVKNSLLRRGHRSCIPTSAGKLILTYADEDYVESYLKDCDCQSLDAEHHHQRRRASRRVSGDPPAGATPSTMREVEIGLAASPSRSSARAYTLQGIISVRPNAPHGCEAGLMCCAELWRSARAVTDSRLPTGIGFLKKQASGSAPDTCFFRCIINFNLPGFYRPSPAHTMA